MGRPNDLHLGTYLCFETLALGKPNVKVSHMLMRFDKNLTLKPFLVSKRFLSHASLDWLHFYRKVVKWSDLSFHQFRSQSHVIHGSY